MVASSLVLFLASALPSGFCVGISARSKNRLVVTTSIVKRGESDGASRGVVNELDRKRYDAVKDEIPTINKGVHPWKFIFNRQIRQFWKRLFRHALCPVFIRHEASSLILRNRRPSRAGPDANAGDHRRQLFYGGGWKHAGTHPRVFSCGARAARGNDPGGHGHRQTNQAANIVIVVPATFEGCRVVSFLKRESGFNKDTLMLCKNVANMALGFKACSIYFAPYVNLDNLIGKDRFELARELVTPANNYHEPASVGMTDVMDLSTVQYCLDSGIYWAAVSPNIFEQMPMLESDLGRDIHAISPR